MSMQSARFADLDNDSMEAVNGDEFGVKIPTDSLLQKRAGLGVDLKWPSIITQNTGITAVANAFYYVPTQDLTFNLPDPAAAAQTRAQIGFMRAHNDGALTINAGAFQIYGYFGFLRDNVTSLTIDNPGEYMILLAHASESKWLII